MKSKLTILIMLLTFGLISCVNWKSNVAGSWVVDAAFIHNEPAIWNMYSNGFDLKDDNTCILPIGDWSHRNTDMEKGYWNIYKNNHHTFLKITSENEVFGRTFEVISMNRILDTTSGGYLMKMSLVADSLELKCTRAIY